MTIAAILRAKREGGSEAVVRVAADTPIRDLIDLLAERRIGAVPVMADDSVAGIISERDVVLALRRDGAAILDWPVERIMTRPAISVPPETSLLAGLSLMTRRRIRHLPVIEGGRMIGFVSIGDLVKARIERIEAEAEAMRVYIAT